VLADFLQKDKDKGPDSRCAHMHKYYTQNIVPNVPKVKVAKDKGKLNGKNRFDYDDQDYNFEQEWKVKVSENVPGQLDAKGNPKKAAKLVKPRAIDYIGKSYPHC
jgi:hypothetical protein